MPEFKTLITYGLCIGWLWFIFVYFAGAFKVGFMENWNIMNRMHGPYTAVSVIGAMVLSVALCLYIMFG